MSKTGRHKGAHSTRFVCHAPEAKAVFLAGTFNGWSPEATPMTRDAEGNWSVAVTLKPGRYEYTSWTVPGAVGRGMTATIKGAGNACRTRSVPRTGSSR